MEDMDDNMGNMGMDDNVDMDIADKLMKTKRTLSQHFQQMKVLNPDIWT